jgi:chromate transporter
MDKKTEHTPLSEIAKLFLKLGIIGFGGPAVHIAMMEEEVVQKRKWMNHNHFLDLVGATNLIPGPNSTEMAMHIGRERGGWRGLLVAGCCFILPAVLITAFFAWAYKRYGTLPQADAFIYGIKPAIIAVIIVLMIRLGKKAFKTIELWIIGSAVAVLAIAGYNEIYLLFGAGLVGILWQVLKKKTLLTTTVLPFALLQINNLSLDTSKWKLFWIFLKIGSILYGSGYVLFAFLDTELVEKGLLSHKELVDAIAVGQFTPGPVFSSATFIGWQMGNFPGAVAATAGIFLPSFLFVAFLNPLLPALRKSRLMSAFLDFVNVASIALILAICVELGKDAVHDWRTILIAVLGLLVTLFFKKLNTAFVIIGGGFLGYLLTLI